jgi:hypothetical protein
LALSDGDFVGVAEISPQLQSMNGDAALAEVLEHLERIAIPRFLSVRARNAHHPFWAQIPALFGNDAVSRASAALIEGALYDGEVRQLNNGQSSVSSGIATGSLIGVPYIPAVTSSVSLVRLKVSPLVDTRAFNAVQGLTCPVVLDYNASCPTIDQVLEHVALASVAMGACFIEKHFTLDRSLPGPDHPFAMEPAELAAMVRAIRNIEIALGDGVKRISASEAKNRPAARKSLVAARAIKQGERFSADNVTAKRPGSGLSPMLWDDVIGQVARRDFDPDALISL